MKTFTKPAHTIENGYCTVCHDTAEWLESRDQACDYIIPAGQAQAGDYLHTTQFGSRRGATIGIGSVTHDGDWTILHTAQTAFRVPTHDTITVSR